MIQFGSYFLSLAFVGLGLLSIGSKAGAMGSDIRYMEIPANFKCLDSLGNPVLVVHDRVDSRSENPKYTGELYQYGFKFDVEVSASYLDYSDDGFIALEIFHLNEDVRPTLTLNSWSNDLRISSNQRVEFFSGLQDLNCGIN